MEYADSAGFGLIRSDRADAYPILEAEGVEPHGWAWSGIARVLLAEHAPKLVDLIAFDCEAADGKPVRRGNRM
jgi:hypothetical protein